MNDIPIVVGSRSGLEHRGVEIQVCRTNLLAEVVLFGQNLENDLAEIVGGGIGNYR